MSVLGKFKTRYLALMKNDLRFLAIKITNPSSIRVGGIKVPASSELYSKRIQKNIFRGTYERAEIEIITRNISKDDRVLEIGAGIGAVSALCALTVGGDNVTCVEANPSLEPLIRKTHELNGVRPNLLIGLVDREEGEGVLYADGNLTASSVYVHSDQAKAISIKKLSISKLLASVKPTFLIVDIEGHEFHLFDDLDLSQLSKACVELHPDMIGDDGCLHVINTFAKQGLFMKLRDTRERSYYFERIAN